MVGRGSRKSWTRPQRQAGFRWSMVYQADRRAEPDVGRGHDIRPIEVAHLSPRLGGVVRPCTLNGSGTLNPPVMRLALSGASPYHELHDSTHPAPRLNH